VLRAKITVDARLLAHIRRTSVATSWSSLTKDPASKLRADVVVDHPEEIRVGTLKVVQPWQNGQSRTDPTPPDRHVPSDIPDLS
jgi:hypothetical protein